MVSKLRGHADGVGSPFFYHFLHIGGNVGVELDPLAGARVGEAKFLGMECVAGQDLEAIVHKLLVFGEDRALDDMVAAVGGVIEEGVAFVLHVDTYLVGASSLKS